MIKVIKVIILGEKYRFTEDERKKLTNIANMHELSYKERNDDEIITLLESYIDASQLIVLNTTADVSDKVIAYLTQLEFKGINYITIEHFLEQYLQKCYIPEHQTDLHFLEDVKAFTLWQYMQKRFIDFFGVFWLFFFSWPVMLYARYKIQKQSPGAIFFKQDRVGEKGKLFKCTKFRTMHEDSHHDPYTQENDTRIFPYAKTMRKTRIDELPQMWNILKGEMHLIGPRAEWNILVENYEKQLPYYCSRHIVAPGITGWAQVNYPYGQNIEDTRQKLMYDLYYIKYWSIGLELKIVWKTAMTVVGKKGL